MNGTEVQLLCDDLCSIEAKAAEIDNLIIKLAEDVQAQKHVEGLS